MIRELIPEARTYGAALVVAAGLGVLFSVYAGCIPISDGLPAVHVCVVDRPSFIVCRIIVVLLWLLFAVTTHPDHPLSSRYVQFLCGALPGLVLAVLLFWFIFPLYSADLHEFMTARDRSPYRSLGDLQVRYFRSFVTAGMVGLSYGVVSGLFARGFRSPGLAILIGLVMCIAQVAVDAALLFAGFYGMWFLGPLD